MYSPRRKQCKEIFAVHVQSAMLWPFFLCILVQLLFSGRWPLCSAANGYCCDRARGGPLPSDIHQVLGESLRDRRRWSLGGNTSVVSRGARRERGQVKRYPIMASYREGWRSRLHPMFPDFLFLLWYALLDTDSWSRVQFKSCSHRLTKHFNILSYWNLNGNLSKNTNQIWQEIYPLLHSILIASPPSECPTEICVVLDILEMLSGLNSNLTKMLDTPKRNMVNALGTYICYVFIKHTLNHNSD